MATALERFHSRLNNEFSHKVDGTYYHSPEEYIKNDVKNMEIKVDDIALVTYPKCGTHWVQKILCYLRDDGDLDTIKQHPFMPLDILHPSAPVRAISMIEAMPSPRIIVTHYPFELCPLGIQEGKCKIIYVVRNPKDVAVSLFHFQKQIKAVGDFEDFSWNDFFEVFCHLKDNPLHTGSWFENVKNWLRHRDDGNILFVTFEELKRDSAECIKKMAAFLGRDIDLERANRIADLCDFKSMRAQAEKRDIELAGKSPVKITAFVRKGEVGDWKNYFTVAMNDRFEELYQSEMEGIDLNVEFEI